MYTLKRSVGGKTLARTPKDMVPHSYESQVEMVILDIAFDVAPDRSGLLTEYMPSYVSPSSIVQLPSPPVVQGDIGNIPLSKFSEPGADMHVVSSLGCCVITILPVGLEVGLIVMTFGLVIVSVGLDVEGLILGLIVTIF